MYFTGRVVVKLSGRVCVTSKGIAWAMATSMLWRPSGSVWVVPPGGTEDEVSRVLPGSCVSPCRFLFRTGIWQLAMRQGKLPCWRLWDFGIWHFQQLCCTQRLRWRVSRNSRVGLLEGLPAQSIFCGIFLVNVWEWAPGFSDFQGRVLVSDSIICYAISLCVTGQDSALLWGWCAVTHWIWKGHFRVQLAWQSCVPRIFVSL